MARLATEGSLATSEILDDYFEFGLQRVLDGLDRYIGQAPHLPGRLAS